MEQPKLETIADKMKFYRNLVNMSQEDLSLAADINISTIKKYECGIRNPKPDQLVKLSDALGVSLIEFMPYKFNSTNDIISTLRKLLEHSDVKVEADTDDEGKYIPESVRLNFDNKSINEFLIDYISKK